MPLVKNTITGNNYLQKINTDGDSCSRTAIRSYNKQLGGQGTNGRTQFYLPFNYDPSSHTLWVFVNGEKAVVEQTAVRVDQYEETDNKSVTFGAAVPSDAVLEFIVAGSYLNDEEVGGTGGGGGLTWILTSDPLSVINNYGYMTDTTLGPIQFELPEVAIEGDTFAVTDAFGTFGTNAVTLHRLNPLHKVEHSLTDYVLDNDGMSLQLVFDGIDNWVSVNNYDHNLLINYLPEEHRKITSSTGLPTGGEDGDIWITTF